MHTLTLCCGTEDVLWVVRLTADTNDDTAAESCWWEAIRRDLLPTDDERRCDRLLRGPVLLATCDGIGCGTTRGMLITGLMAHNNSASSESSHAHKEEDFISAVKGEEIHCTLVSSHSPKKRLQPTLPLMLGQQSPCTAHTQYDAKCL